MYFFIPLIVATMALTNVAPVRVHVIYVSSPGETFTHEQKLAARAQVRRGLQYWNDLQASSPGLHMVTEQDVSVNDPFSAHQWMTAYAAPGVMTLIVIANTNSRAEVQLGGGVGSHGFAYPHRQHLAFCTTATYPEMDGDGWYTGACVAHELGHTLYDLSDGGAERADGRPSIMNYPDLAYQQWLLHPADRATLVLP